MGRYDEVDPEDLRQHLVRIAKLILRLEEDGVLLQEAARLQKVFGDLRQKLFAYEIRSAANLAPPEATEDEETEREAIDPLLEDSHRIVREAREREEELRNELGRESPVPENEEDEDEDEE